MTRTIQEERELCKRDVCMYCGGRALGYRRVPDGPNEAGNWTHQYTTTQRSQDRVLCEASAIFARERFEQLQETNQEYARAMDQSAQMPKITH